MICGGEREPQDLMPQIAAALNAAGGSATAASLALKMVPTKPAPALRTLFLRQSLMQQVVLAAWLAQHGHLLPALRLLHAACVVPAFHPLMLRAYTKQSPSETQT